MRGLATRLLGLTVLCLAARGFAQPAPDPAPPAAQPDYAKATELYNSATQAMTESRFDDAARDFVAAYEITRDPVVYFKIGTAYEKAGKCSEALGYYIAYLDEAKPNQQFATLTRERIAACKAMLPKPEAASPPNGAQPPGTPPGPGAQKPELAAPAPPPEREQPSKNKDRAWLFVGGSLAFVTAGAVLAYSVKSSEQDIKDLYVSDNGNPPPFTPETQQRYEDLVAEGNRYEKLAWTSFGIAAGCAGAATFFFLRARNEVTVAPIVTPKQTGVTATLRF